MNVANTIPAPKTVAEYSDRQTSRRAEQSYVNRRQFTKFLVLTSLGTFVGNL